MFDRGAQSRGAVVVYQQVHPHWAKIPAFDLYALEKSQFTRRHITFAGFPVVNSSLDWNFCVYRKNQVWPKDHRVSHQTVSTTVRSTR